MINYVLGKAGVGKTSYCLRKFEASLDAVFFTLLMDSGLTKVPDSQVVSLGEEFEGKCIVDLTSFYRKNLETRENFSAMIFKAVEAAIENGARTIFLDEFQLYYTQKLKDLILNSDCDFYIIHQFPLQLDQEIFTALWKKTDKKYLLDPYQPSEFYSV
ncbi:MAG: hypothetical protein AAB373_01145 [Patescibacteria group bacterium]